MTPGRNPANVPAPPTSQKPAMKREENIQLQCNGTYSAMLIVCIFNILALTGLAIALFIAFTNIRAVKTDLEMLAQVMETAQQEKIRVVNSSVTDMLKNFNDTQSTLILELIEDSVLTNLAQGIFGRTDPLP